MNLCPSALRFTYALNQVAGQLAIGFQVILPVSNQAQPPTPKPNPQKTIGVKLVRIKPALEGVADRNLQKRITKCCQQQWLNVGLFVTRLKAQIRVLRRPLQNTKSLRKEAF